MNRVEWPYRWGRLIDLLAAHPSSDRTFNQYRDVRHELDRPDGAMARRRNLCTYLETFGGARYILVGEAAGYAGCRFSGIPFTSEAQVAGAQRLAWTAGLRLERSSKAGDLWVERSATIVWEAIGSRRDFLLWNAFPWHPVGGRGPLSNGRPGRDLSQGLTVLRCLLALLPRARPCAVGRVAQRALAALGMDAPYIRHPSHGGKRQFGAGLAALPVMPETFGQRRQP